MVQQSQTRMAHMITCRKPLLLIFFIPAVVCFFLVPANCDNLQDSALVLEVLKAQVFDRCPYTHSNVTLTTTAKLARNPKAYIGDNGEQILGKLRALAYDKSSKFPKEDFRSIFSQKEHARCIYNKMHTVMQKINILTNPEASFICIAYIRASLASHERIVGSLIGVDRFYIPFDEHAYLHLLQKMVRMSAIASNTTYNHVTLLSLAVSSPAPPQDVYLHHATTDRVWQNFSPVAQKYKPQATTLNFSFALPAINLSIATIDFGTE